MELFGVFTAEKQRSGACAEGLLMGLAVLTSLATLRETVFYF